MAWKENVTPDEAIEFLNAVREVDAAAMAQLIEQRVPCNRALADHPTVQVQQEMASPSACVVGVLGILNGLFGIDEDGWGPISAVFEDDGTLTSFKRTEHPEGWERG